jgi:hypothetical protein
LKSYQQLLNQYHLHPEAKFTNGDYLDSGLTSRRHVIACGVEQIGKEANRLEEQWYVGADADAQIHYGFAPQDLPRLIRMFKKAAKEFGVRNLAEAAGISAGHVRRILKGESLSEKLCGKLVRAVKVIEETAR